MRYMTAARAIAILTSIQVGYRATGPQGMLNFGRLGALLAPKSSIINGGKSLPQRDLERASPPDRLYNNPNRFNGFRSF